MCANMFNPPHPGTILKLDVFEPLDLSISKASEILGVHRNTLNSVINGSSSISVDMALRLATVFNTTPNLWLNLQIEYDIFQRKNALQDELDKLKQVSA